MKLYLFGGAEIDETKALPLKKLFNEVLNEIKPKQLLHIPYARTVVPEGEENIWGEGWVNRDLNLDGIELIDARNEGDFKRAKNPAIFMNGGLQRNDLYDAIISNKKLNDLVIHAEYIIGESAGAMVCAEYRRTYPDNDKSKPGYTTKGLGLLPDTIIEAHYSQRNRQQQLRDEMKESGAKYGIGIDSYTGVIIDTNDYPDVYQVVGDGLVDFVRLEDL